MLNLANTLHKLIGEIESKAFAQSRATIATRAFFRAHVHSINLLAKNNALDEPFPLRNHN